MPLRRRHAEDERLLKRHRISPGPRIEHVDRAHAPNRLPFEKGRRALCLDRGRHRDLSDDRDGGRRAAGLHVFAPCGLSELLGLIVRPNKKQITQTIYDAKVKKWRARWPDLRIVAW